MITPTFKVEQDNNSVTIVINTPYVRAQDVDLHVEGSEFRFYLRPYFLRLHFPGNIIEDDDSKAVYDPSAGQFNIRVTKETKGEHFADLDLLTKLLARTGETTSKTNEPKKPLIEVIGGDASETLEDAEIQDAIDFNWELPQEIPTMPELSTKAQYGFNNQYHGYFNHVQETMNEINEIAEPEKSTTESRRIERIESENSHFDEDHYCMDYVNDDETKELIKYKTLYSKELKRVQKNAKSAATSKPLIQEIDAPNDLDMDGLSIDDKNGSLLKFSSKEEGMMRDLPNKEYLLSNEKATYLGLVDLMFAYCYNDRITEGDNNVESVWCVGRISSTLSSLDQFSVLKDVLISSYRRALTYPLYRNLTLCEKVLQDVYIMFRLGKRAILKALLGMKYLFDHHDVYYVYSKIYLDDYCVWIQHSSDNVLRTLAHELHHLKIEKNELGWEIEELEQIAEQMKDMEGEMEQENEQDMQRAEMIL